MRWWWALGLVLALGASSVAAEEPPFGIGAQGGLNGCG